jgi:hypothetical protein
MICRARPILPIDTPNVDGISAETAEAVAAFLIALVEAQDEPQEAEALAGRLAVGQGKEPGG